MLEHFLPKQLLEHFFLPQAYCLQKWCSFFFYASLIRMLNSLYASLASLGIEVTKNDLRSLSCRHTACKSDVSSNIVVSSGVRGNTTCDPSDSCNCDPSDTCITDLWGSLVTAIPFYTSLVSKKWCSFFSTPVWGILIIGLFQFVSGMLGSTTTSCHQWWVPFQCITSSTLHRVTTDRMHPLGIGVYWVDAPVHIIMTFTIYQNSILLHITQEMNIVLKSITLIFPL